MNKKRKFNNGRPAAMTKIGNKKINPVRVRGGHTKHRALRLDSGNFVWQSEGCGHKTRIIDVLYNAANSEFVRTKVLTKGSVVQIDATPFKQWYTKKYNTPLGAKKGKPLSDVDQATLATKRSGAVTRKIAARNKTIDVEVAAQASTGRFFARVSSRPGQSGRCDGYILEGKELSFYEKKFANK
jgi:small subunit ribosomal protein S8e